MPFCANCGTVAKGAARYCTQCGAPLKQPSQDADSAPDPRPQPHSPGRAAAGDESPRAGDDRGMWPPPNDDQASGPWASEAWSARSWFPDDPAPGPWFRDERPPGPAATQEQATPPSARENQASGPGAEDQQAPATAEPLTLSEPVWVTEFFRDRPPDVPAAKPAPASPSRRSPRWTGRVTALAAVVVLLAGGVITWRLVGGQPGLAPGGQSSDGSGAPGTPATPSTAASTQATASPTAGRPGRNTVATAPALANTPAARHVVAFLETYFRAINQRDYPLYSSLLAANMRPPVREFETGYRSTSDSGAVLTSLSTGPRGLAATVAFTSHQDPALSPDHTRCTNWNITLYLRRYGAGYLIVRPPRGYHAAHRPCA
jgi:hypothetical protein